MKYYIAYKKNEILPFAIAWVKLMDTMLSEISQVKHRKTNTVSSHLHVEFLKSQNHSSRE